MQWHCLVAWKTDDHIIPQSTRWSRILVQLGKKWAASLEKLLVKAERVSALDDFERSDYQDWVDFVRHLCFLALNWSRLRSHTNVIVASLLPHLQHSRHISALMAGSALPGYFNMIPIARFICMNITLVPCWWDTWHIRVPDVCMSLSFLFHQSQIRNLRLLNVKQDTKHKGESMYFARITYAKLEGPLPQKIALLLQPSAYQFQSQPGAATVIYIYIYIYGNRKSLVICLEIYQQRWTLTLGAQCRSYKYNFMWWASNAVISSRHTAAASLWVGANIEHVPSGHSRVQWRGC